MDFIKTNTYKVLTISMHIPLIALIFLLNYLFDISSITLYFALAWVAFFSMMNIISQFSKTENTSNKPLGVIINFIISASIPIGVTAYHLFANYFWSTLITLIVVYLIFYFLIKSYNNGKRNIEKKIERYLKKLFDGTLEVIEEDFKFKDQIFQLASTLKEKDNLVSENSTLKREKENLFYSNNELKRLNESNKKKLNSMSNIIDTQIPYYSKMETEYQISMEKLKKQQAEEYAKIADSSFKEKNIMKRKHKKELTNFAQKKEREIKKVKDEKEREIKKMKDVHQRYINQLENSHKGNMDKITDKQKRDFEKIKEIANKNLDMAIADIKNSYDKKLKDYLLSHHDTEEKEFSSSIMFDKQLEEDKMKARKYELFKKEVRAEIKENDLKHEESSLNNKKEFFEKHKDLEGQISEEKNQRRRDFFGLQTNISDLKSYVLENMYNLKLFVKEGFLKIQQSANSFKLQVEKEFNDMKFKWGEDFALLTNQQLKLVNKFEGFQIMYDGDKRELKQQIEGIYLTIDRVAFEAHKYTEKVRQTFSDEILALKNADFELQKNLFLVEANLRQSISDLETKVDRNALVAAFEREEISKKMQWEIEKVTDKINLTNSELRFLIKESHFTMKNFVNQNFTKIMSDLNAHRSQTAIKFEKISNRLNISIADIKYLVNQKNYELKDFTIQNFNRIEKDIQTNRFNTKQQLEKLSQKMSISVLEMKYLIKEKNYQMRDFVKANISKIEKDLENFRIQNREQIFNLDKKYSSQLENLAFKFGIQIKDLYHLMNTGDLTIKHLLGKSQTELKAMIDKMKSENNVLHANSETRWSTRMKDMEIQNERKHFATLRIIQGFKDEMINFNSSIASMQNELGRIELSIKKYGIDNENVKKDANRLLNDANDVLAQITNTIRDFDDKVVMVNDKMTIKAKQYMLDAKQVVEQQKNALQQIALGEKGVELMFNEKESSVRKIQDEVNLKEKEIKRIEAQGKQDLLTELNLAELRRQRDNSREALRRENEVASFWKKEYNKKPTYSKYHVRDFDFPEE